MYNVKKAHPGGYALVTALLFFLTAGSAVVAAISDGAFRETRAIQNESHSKQSYFTSESAVEDAAYRIKNLFDIGSSETLSFASSTATVSIGTDASGATVLVSSADSRGMQRSTELTLGPGTNIAFPYALQSGLGGIDMSGSSRIIGDIYSAGSIRGCSSCQITGLAVAAGKSTSNLSEDNSAPALPAQSIVFGNANASQDLGQSFTVDEELSLIKIAVYIRKTGNPSNATVRIVTNNGSQPSTSVLASGTLSSSLVSSSYDWEEITLTANPVLTVGTTYWIVIDANTNSSNYYTVGANSSYANGQAKVGRYNNQSWNNTSPSGLDSYFRVYIGTNEDGITGENEWNRLSVGSAYSYEASYVNATGALYCQIGTSNNKACDTSRADPIVEPAPVSTSAIDFWKTEASADVYSGNYSRSDSSIVTLGPKKIEGNMTIAGSVTLRVSGTLWITGNLVFDGSAVILPDNNTENYAVVVDGTVTLGGSAQILGSDGSHILITSLSTADPAITIGGSADDTVVFTPNGGLYVTGSGNVNAAAAKHITLDGSAQVEYDPDVSEINLPGGTGTSDFNISSWKEVQ